MSYEEQNGVSSMKIIYRNNKPTTIFAFAERHNDLQGIKPYHVRTYCGCKCIEISEHGYGTMQLCDIHVVRTHLGIGAVLTPQIKVTIPQTTKEGIKARIKRLIKEIRK